MESSIEMKGSGTSDFNVDEILNLPNGEDGEALCEADNVAEEVNLSGDNSTISTTVGSCNSSLSGPEGRCFLPGAILTGEICEPQLDCFAVLDGIFYDYQEDSFSTEDLQKLQYISPSGIKSNTLSTKPVINIETISTTVKTEPTVISATIPSPSSSFSNRKSATGTKARRKRSSRARGLTCWLSSSVLSPRPVGPKDSDSANPILVKKPFKQQKKKEMPMFASAPPSAGRRCLHCETDKTPQWRTGPMGPKTLCNACGVRYKSGRLVPEYRPAASPTFVVSKHSNSHRKVLELRRQKEMHVPHFQHQQLLLHGASPVHAQNGDDYLIHNPIGPDFRQLI